MLVAVLNTCTKEELEEEDEALDAAETTPAEAAERKKVIKNKIMAVGRMSKVFALLRWVSLRSPACPLLILRCV